MASIAVKLPLTRDSVNGWKMIVGFKALIKQNIKMLLLTVPGERVMFPDYGVGLKTYLFSNFSGTVYAEIEDKIREQVKSYMPAVSINKILFQTDEDASTLGISLLYSIPNIGMKDLLQITI
jgi:phage baseplate assembly protein W